MTPAGWTLRSDAQGVDWQRVSDLLKTVGMASFEPSLHQRAFANSQVVVFVHEGPELIGFGRALTDGVYQAALYDVVVHPDFQGRGMGRLIVETLLEGLPQRNVILYAAVGKESFYEKLGFHKMTTAMARFRDPDRMRRMGFIE